MPLFRRLPKRGFNNMEFAKNFEVVNIKAINEFFKDGEEVTREALIEKGLVTVKKGVQRKNPVLIKVLGNGSLTKKLTIHADAFSKSALKAIQDCGGEARLTKEI